jgi:hypothetical protein
MRFALGSQTSRQASKKKLQQCCFHITHLQTQQQKAGSQAGRTAPPSGAAAGKQAKHVILTTLAAAACDMSGTEAAAAVVSGWCRPYSPGPLTEAEYEQYWQQGYIIKRGLLTQDDINPCLAAIERWVFRTLASHSPNVRQRSQQAQLFLCTSAPSVAHSFSAVRACCQRCLPPLLLQAHVFSHLFLTPPYTPRPLAPPPPPPPVPRRVDQVACRLLAAGLISEPAADADVFTRLTLLEQQFREAR